MLINMLYIHYMECDYYSYIILNGKYIYRWNSSCRDDIYTAQRPIEHASFKILWERWNAGSDDFVLSSALAIGLRFLW